MTDTICEDQPYFDITVYRCPFLSANTRILQDKDIYSTRPLQAFIVQRRNNEYMNWAPMDDHDSIHQGEVMQHGDHNRNSQLSIIQNEGFDKESPVHFHIPHNDISQEQISQEGSDNVNTQLTVIQNEASRRLNRVIPENPSELFICT